MYTYCFAAMACLLSFGATLGQKNTIIQGKLNGFEDKKITIYPPFDGFLNGEYGIECPVVNDAFSFSYPMAHAGFVEIESKTISRRMFYLQPGDKVLLLARRVDGKLWFGLNGSKNRRGNALLLTWQTDLEDRPSVSRKLIPTLAGAKNVEAAFSLVCRFIDTANKTIDSLYHAKVIQDSLYHALSAFQESVVVNTCCDYLANARLLAEKDSLSAALPIGVAGYNELLWYLLTTYDPFDEKYRSSYAEENNLLLKGELIRLHILPVQSAGQRIYWAPDHKSFAETLDTLGRPFTDTTFWSLTSNTNKYSYIYVPGAGQQLLQSHCILLSLLHGSEPTVVLKQMINLYACKYPASDILPFFYKELQRRQGYRSLCADADSSVSGEFPEHGYIYSKRSGDR